MKTKFRCAIDDEIIYTFKSNFPSLNFITNYDGEYLRLKIFAREFLHPILLFVKNCLGYNFLIDLFAIDYLYLKEENDNKRFKVIYNLYSFEKNHRFFIEIPLDENEIELDSVVDLWDSANWFEREVYDMFGIKFKNHPNLKRILMYDGFEGHPLRKDYPIHKRQPIIGPLD
ncbi:MAG: NADH-quinone oxidoreductase subunit C [Planctomycetota bacterium]